MTADTKTRDASAGLGGRRGRFDLVGRIVLGRIGDVALERLGGGVSVGGFVARVDHGGRLVGGGVLAAQTFFRRPDAVGEFVLADEPEGAIDHAGHTAVGLFPLLERLVTLDE